MLKEMKREEEEEEEECSTLVSPTSDISDISDLSYLLHIGEVSHLSRPSFTRPAPHSPVSLVCTSFCHRALVLQAGVPTASSAAR